MRGHFFLKQVIVGLKREFDANFKNLTIQLAKFSPEKFSK
jgi:hypothetical protein